MCPLCVGGGGAAEDRLAFFSFNLGAWADKRVCPELGTELEAGDGLVAEQTY